MIKRTITGAICAYLNELEWPAQPGGTQPDDGVKIPVFTERIEGAVPAEALHFAFAESRIFKAPGNRHEFEAIGVLTFLSPCHTPERLRRAHDILDRVLLDNVTVKKGQIAALLQNPEIDMKGDLPTLRFRVTASLRQIDKSPCIKTIFYNGRIQ